MNTKVRGVLRSAAIVFLFLASPSLVWAGDCVSLTRSISLGMHGDDVSSLQSFLGLSPTGYFGLLTQKALQKWQAANGIVRSGSPATTGYGATGKLTRARMACPSSVLSSQSANACVQLTVDLTLGSSGPEVRSLQQFLYDQLHLEGLAATYVTLRKDAVVTGTFTNGTKNLLLQYQVENQLSHTGIADNETRAAINGKICGHTVITDTSPVVQPSAAPSPECATRNVSGAAHPYQPCAPVITSIEPSHGPLGTKVTIKGSGFTSDSVVHFGDGVTADSIATDGTVITFSVPSGNIWKSGREVSTGEYKIAVTNKNGTSNESSYGLTVTLLISVTPPTSNSLIPQNLIPGESGTWTVGATGVGIQSSAMTYEANWGDGTPDSSVVRDQADVVANHVFDKAQLTHAYKNVGTYSPTFIITDSFGDTVQKTVPITIGN